MKIGRLVISGAAIGTVVGTGRADLNATHVFNPRWPVIAWLPFFPALLTRGTAVEDVPGHLPRIAKIPVNLIPAALVPAVSALGYPLHRRGI